MTMRIDAHHIELVDDRVAAALRSKTPAERLAMCFDAEKLVRLLMAAGIRYQHPDWDEEQVQWEVARRFLCGSD